MGHKKHKLLVIGYARHGKDSVCEFLRDEYNYSFVSSSHYCAEHVVIPYLRTIGITYDSIEECYEDRVNHRDKWFNCIADFSREKPGEITRGIMETNDIYCGMRNRIDYNKAIEDGVFDLILWVDASDRHPPEDPSSNSLTPEDADFVLDNNGDVDGLEINIRYFMGNIDKYVKAAKTRRSSIDSTDH